MSTLRLFRNGTVVSTPGKSLRLSDTLIDVGSPFDQRTVNTSGGTGDGSFAILAGNYWAGSGDDANADTVDGTGSGAKLYFPNGLAIAPNGDGYFTEFGYEPGSGPPSKTAGNVIRRFNRSTGEVVTVAGTPTAPEDHTSLDGVGSAARFHGLVALSPTTTGLIIAEYIGSRLRFMDYATRTVSTLAILDDTQIPNGVWMHTDGMVYFVGYSVSAPNDGHLSRYDPATGEVTRIAGSLALPANIVGVGTKLYILGFTSGILYQCDLADGNAISTLTESLGENSNGAALGDECIYYVVSSGADDAVMRVSLSDYSVTRLSGGTPTEHGDGSVDYYAPTAIAYDGTHLYVVELYGSTLKKLLDPSGSSGGMELIPAERRVTWTGNVGSDEDYDARTQWGPTLDATATAADIMAAVNGCTENYKFIALAAGVYSINPLIVTNYHAVTLRGAGPGLTVLYMKAGTSGTPTNEGISWAGNTESPYDYDGAPDIIAGLTKGSTAITVSDGSSFLSGRMLTIAEQSDYTLPATDVHGPDWTPGAKWPRQMQASVLAVDGDVITIWPPLLWTLNPALTPKARQYGTNFNAPAIEDLTLRLDDGYIKAGIVLQQSRLGRIKNVHVTGFRNYGIVLRSVVGVNTAHNWLTGKGAGAQSNGGLLVENATACMDEDGIIENIVPGIEVNRSSGNAFLYPYISRTNFINDGTAAVSDAVDSNHGPHPFMNLYEGVIGPRFRADGYFGSSSHDTVFRCWFHIQSPVEASSAGCPTIRLCKFTRFYNVVCNRLGYPGQTFQLGGEGSEALGSTPPIYSFGFPNLGNNSFTGTASLIGGTPWANWLVLWPSDPNSAFQELDLDVKGTLLLRGNYNYATGSIRAEESLAGYVVPDSLVYPAKPPWWGDVIPYPLNTMSGEPSLQDIPAGARFAAGKGYFFVTFNGNEADSGSMPPQVAGAGVTAALADNGFAKTDFGFATWNTAADQSGVNYPAGGDYSFDADVKLYAIWGRTVTFNGNGADGGEGMQPTSRTAPEALNLNTYERSGYAFVGWNTAADGSGTAYSDGQTYDYVANLTLFAQWESVG